MYKVGAPNGTWTAVSADTSTWSSICWSQTLGTFCVVSSAGGTSAVMTSIDGIRWYVRTTPSGSQTWSSVTWAPVLGLFCAVSNANVGNDVMTSPDGINWTLQTSITGSNWVSIVWQAIPGRFYVIANNSTSPGEMYSPDGINWVANTSFPLDNTWTSIASSPTLTNRLAVVGSTLNNYQVVTYGSADVTGTDIKVNGIFGNNNDGVNVEGVQFTSGEIQFQPGTTDITNGIISGVGGLGVNNLWTSSTTVPTTGSPSWVSVAGSNNLLMAISPSSATTTQNIMYSTDGNTWIQPSAASVAAIGGTTNTWTDIVWDSGNGRWIVVGSGPNFFVASSVDPTNASGSQWLTTTLPVGFSGKPYALCNGDTIHSVMGISTNSTNTNQIIVTKDGATWLGFGGPGVVGGLSAICFASAASGISNNLDTFVVTTNNASGNAVYTSVNDGNSWSQEVTPSTQTWKSICFSPELILFVAVANGGTGARVMTSSDSIIWTANPTNTVIDSISWGNVIWVPLIKLFYAISSTTPSIIMYSTNGFTWSFSTPASTTQTWTKLAYINSSTAFKPIIASVSATQAMYNTANRNPETQTAMIKTDVINSKTGNSVYVEGTSFRDGVLYTKQPFGEMYNYSAATVAATSAAITFPAFSAFVSRCSDIVFNVNTISTSLQFTYTGNFPRLLRLKFIMSAQPPSATVKTLTLFYGVNGINTTPTSGGSIAQVGWASATPTPVIQIVLEDEFIVYPNQFVSIIGNTGTSTTFVTGNSSWFIGDKSYTQVS